MAVVDVEAVGMNTKKTINVISYYFEPENTPRAFRTFELVRVLCESGYRVRLIVPDFVPRTYRHPNLELIETPGGYILNRTRLGSEEGYRRPRSLAWRYDLKLARILLPKVVWPDIRTVWARLAARHLLTARVDLAADATISIGLPIAPHLLTAALARSQEVVGNLGCLVAEYGDPFSVSKLDGDPKNVDREKKLLEVFDHIVVPTPGAQELFSQLKSAERIHVIPQGFKAPENLTRHPPEPDSTEGLHGFYGGVFYGEYRNPNNLMLALQMLDRQEKPVRLTIRTSDDISFIFGDTPGLYELTMKYTEVLPLVSRRRFLQELESHDFAVNFLGPHQSQIPSKAIDYALTQVPVLEIRPADSPECIAEKLESREFVQYPFRPEHDIRNVLAAYEKVMFGDSGGVSRQSPPA